MQDNIYRVKLYLILNRNIDCHEDIVQSFRFQADVQFLNTKGNFTR